MQRQDCHRIECGCVLAGGCALGINLCTPASFINAEHCAVILGDFSRTQIDLRSLQQPVIPLVRVAQVGSKFGVETGLGEFPPLRRQSVCQGFAAMDNEARVGTQKLCNRQVRRGRKVRRVHNDHRVSSGKGQEVQSCIGRSKPPRPPQRHVPLRQLSEHVLQIRLRRDHHNLIGKQ